LHSVATVGLHGVIGQLVNERASEIAVRLALGAHPRQILRRFVGAGLRWSGVGVAAGFFAFAILQRWMADVLYEVKPFDPWVSAFACSVILVVVVAAVWFPAWRASRIAPQQVLRHE
jgi:ABC-type lipoprotein release transport system permease subunit